MSLKLWALFVAASVALGCRPSSPGDTKLRVRFKTESDPGVSLSEVSLFLGDQAIGVTRDGVLETVIDAYPDRIERIRHICPAGHHQPRADSNVRISPVAPSGPASAMLMEILLRCPPDTHVAAFVVRVDRGAFLPVLLNGVEVAQTDGRGIAVFSRRGAPDTIFGVEIDTSSQPTLRPRSPRQSFQLGNEHEVFAFDLTLTRLRPTRRSRARHRISRIE